MRIGHNTIGNMVIEMESTDSKALHTIVLEVLPAFLELFAKKNAEYGDNAPALGVRGQFADIWRKIGKLKTALWDGHPERLTSETVEEVLHDLLGHVFLTLQMLPDELKMPLTVVHPSAKPIDGLRDGLTALRGANIKSRIRDNEIEAPTISSGIFTEKQFLRGDDL